MADVELVKKAVSGNDEAFLSLLLIYKEDLFRTALAYLKNEEDALEAVQEVTFRAYEKIHTLRKPEYVKTWLIRIMMNYCRDLLRKQKQFVSNEAALTQYEISDDYTFLQVEEALDTLTGQQRELVYMKYLHDIKIKDIAELTATPESTIKTRLYKALSVLKLFFEEKGGSGHV
ncbi:sigma-70 family RNA polymerase sigma factor [Sporosarcina siberiensis]|uniref:Sigma-70 family RNA polymerase sigma factor n=1 Tax=Sporosarcina siberiensis TaxID=1365606 RepID=A0ABW4SDR6_9BACL